MVSQPAEINKVPVRDGTVRSLIRKAGLTDDEFLKLR